MYLNLMADSSKISPQTPPLLMEFRPPMCLEGVKSQIMHPFNTRGQVMSLTNVFQDSNYNEFYCTLPSRFWPPLALTLIPVAISS